MRVLIVVKNQKLGDIWGRHLSRMGAEVISTDSQEEAIETLCDVNVDIIILNTVLGKKDSPMAVADFAGYRQPEAKVIFVSNASFFSDGSLFRYFPNACAFTTPQVSPRDLGALVEYHGLRRSA